jgi:hypothetical protein
MLEINQAHKMANNRETPYYAMTTNNKDVEQHSQVEHQYNAQVIDNPTSSSVPSIQSMDDDDNNNNNQATLQKISQLFPTRLPVWTSAKANLLSAVESQLQADHLYKLIIDGSTPDWSYGLTPLPGFLQSFAKDFVELLRQQAVERVQLGKMKLDEKTKQLTNTAESLLNNVENIYAQRKDVKGWEFAKELVVAFVNRDKHRCVKDLERSLRYTQNNPVQDKWLMETLIKKPRDQIKLDYSCGRKRRDLSPLRGTRRYRYHQYGKRRWQERKNRYYRQSNTRRS